MLPSKSVCVLSKAISRLLAGLTHPLPLIAHPSKVFTAYGLPLTCGAGKSGCFLTSRGVRRWAWSCPIKAETSTSSAWAARGSPCRWGLPSMSHATARRPAGSLGTTKALLISYLTWDLGGLTEKSTILELMICEPWMLPLEHITSSLTVTPPTPNKLSVTNEWVLQVSR